MFSVTPPVPVVLMFIFLSFVYVCVHVCVRFTCVWWTRAHVRSEVGVGNYCHCSFTLLSEEGFLHKTQRSPLAGRCWGFPSLLWGWNSTWVTTQACKAFVWTPSIHSEVLTLFQEVIHHPASSTACSGHFSYNRIFLRRISANFISSHISGYFFVCLFVLFFHYHGQCSNKY